MSNRSDRPGPACPICKRALSRANTTQTHPFCSPRCKLVDLGNWLGDGYVIAGASLDQVEDLDAAALAELLREPS
jgi:endogenous inhibitor of DNA gyrase (YacG/DUF329 family)